MTQIEDKLRWYRYRQALLQSEVADRIGIDQKTYMRYEEYGRDYYPIEHMQKLAGMYDVPVESLLDDYSLFLYKGQGKQVLEARKKLKMTQKEFAYRLGAVSDTHLGSECHPCVKTGGLGDVMYALPRELARLNCDVRVILPRYACIPQEYQDKMVYRGEFYMDLGNTGRNYYVGIMESIWDDVVYDFIDNEEFFSWGSPYTNLVDDIPKLSLIHIYLRRST